MNNTVLKTKRPNLKTKGFSTLHIDIFTYILAGKTNREINVLLGYSKKSHAVVDHSRKVMYKLLAHENLCRKDCTDRVVYPRKYMFWWKKIFDSHKEAIFAVAIEPQFYN